MNYRNQIKIKLRVFLQPTASFLRASAQALGIMLAITAGVFVQPICAQESAPAKLGDQYIPMDGVVLLDVRPADLVAAKNLHLLPMEVAEAWSLDNIGIAPADCESMRFVMATPAMGPQIQPFAALVANLKKPFKVTDLNSQLIFENSEEIDGHTCYVMKGPAGVVFHQPDPQTIILASSGYLDAVTDAAAGSQPGALSKLAAAISHKGQATILVAVEPVRPMINGAMQMFGQQLPPPLMQFTDIPNLLDALLIRVDFEDSEKGLQISMLATDDAAAQKLEKIMMDGFEMGRGIALQQLEATLVDEGAIPDATRAYGKRISEKIGTVVRPERKGRTLTYRLSPAGSVFLPALLAGMAAPLAGAFTEAQDAARDANKGLDARDSLRNLGLAMHNYHSAYRKLPAAVNRSKDGKPLLSWRVHILPFMEEQALYQEFHLDEPWDSEHNIKLLDRMPGYYSHPDFETPNGKTVFQVPVGTGVMFDVDKQTRFRDVLDGLSNTIMVLTTDADSAVEWTKPQDLEIDLENPTNSLGIVNGATAVLMGDGALRFLADPMDGDNVKAMLTRAGKDIVRD